MIGIILVLILILMIKVTTAVSAVKLMNQADVDDKNGTMIVNDWLLSVCCLSSIAYLVLPKDYLVA